MKTITRIQIVIHNGYIVTDYTIRNEDGSEEVKELPGIALNDAALSLLSSAEQSIKIVEGLA